MVLKVGIVAGEASGDILGASIINALKQFYPDLDATGVAGPNMLAAGVKTLFSLEKLSVMGFSEVLLRAPELLMLRHKIKAYFLANPPDIFIGIDAPDFNLPVEIALKKAAIKTVHCNSPTIWAWRKKRIFKIARAVDLMLVLFPFEADYYKAHRIPVNYIGHPLADSIPLQPDTKAMRVQLNLPSDKFIVALLPGSRKGEINYIGPTLLRAAEQFLQACPEAYFISPMVNDACLTQFKTQWQTHAKTLPLTIFRGQSCLAMGAADIVVLASGTATLEAMLLKKPMVVVYKGSLLSYWIAKQLVTIKQFSLPNILAGEVLVPEFIQEAATPNAIAAAMKAWQHDTERLSCLEKRFLTIHASLRTKAGLSAAEAIRALLTS